MKSQDILLLVKVMSIKRSLLFGENNSASFSVRSLGDSLDISKSEISKSIERCRKVALLDTKMNVNRKALFNIIESAVPYFFPVVEKGITTGIPTGFSNPALSDLLSYGGSYLYVWSSIRGNTTGIEVEPIYKSVPNAANIDDFIYLVFSLIDAYRMGRPREKDIALISLKDIFENNGLRNEQ